MGCRNLLEYGDTKRSLWRFDQVVVILWGCNQQEWWHDGDVSGAISPTDREKLTRPINFCIYSSFFCVRLEVAGGQFPLYEPPLVIRIGIVSTMYEAYH